MSDAMVPDADAAEQAVAVDEDEQLDPHPSSSPEVPEADAWEQALEVPLDDERP